MVLRWFGDLYGLRGGCAEEKGWPASRCERGREGEGERERGREGVILVGVEEWV